MNSSSEITEILLEDIVARNAPRTEKIPKPEDAYHTWKFDRLYMQIVGTGIQEPIKVKKINDQPKYTVIDGLKRLAVAEQLDYEKIPAVIVN